MTSALFSINGGTAGEAQNVIRGATVALALNNIAGVRSIQWEIIGTHSASVEKPTITKTGSPAGVTATFDIPDISGGQAYGIRCILNGGKNSAGVSDGDLIAESAVYVLPTSGIRLAYAGESTTRGTHGWIEILNQIASSEVTAGTWAATLANGAITDGTDPVISSGDKVIFDDGATDGELYIEDGFLKYAYNGVITTLG